MLVALVLVALVLTALVLVEVVALVLVALELVALVLVALELVFRVALVVELSVPSVVSPPLPPAELPPAVVVSSVLAASAPPLLSFDELSPVVSLPVAPPVPSLVLLGDVVVELAAVEWMVVVTLPGPLFDTVFVVLDVVFVVSALLARSVPSPDMSSSTALAQLANTTASEVPINSKSRTFTEVSRNAKLRQA